MVPNFVTRTVQAGWDIVTRQVPNYVTRTVQAGWEYVTRQVPHYVTKTVQAGWDVVTRQAPNYVTRTVQAGWEYVQKNQAKVVVGTTVVVVATTVAGGAVTARQDGCIFGLFQIVYDPFTGMPRLAPCDSNIIFTPVTTPTQVRLQYNTPTPGLWDWLTARPPTSTPFGYNPNATPTPFPLPTRDYPWTPQIHAANTQQQQVTATPQATATFTSQPPTVEPATMTAQAQLTATAEATRRKCRGGYNPRETIDGEWICVKKFSWDEVSRLSLEEEKEDQGYNPRDSIFRDESGGLWIGGDRGMLNPFP